MQYNHETEKVAMTNNMIVPRTLLLSENREVQRTRKILIIILGVCLGLSVVALIAAIFGSKLPTETQFNRRTTEVAESIIGILFYGFGLFVARRYSSTGLRVFAWLNIIQLVAMSIGMVLLLFAVIIGFDVISSAASNGGTGVNGLLVGITMSSFLFLILVCAAAFILSVIIVKLTFKLARAIDANQQLIIQQA